MSRPLYRFGPEPRPHSCWRILH